MQHTPRAFLDQETDKTMPLIKTNAITRKWHTLVTLILLFTTPSALAETPRALQSWDYVYFTFIATSVGFFSIAMLALRAYLWLSYSLIALLLVVLMASVDGTLAYMLSKGPQLVDESPLFIGAVTAAAGFCQSAYLIDRNSVINRLKPVVYGLCIVSLSIVPAYWLFYDIQLLYLILNVLLLGMLASTTLPPLSWPRVAPLQRRLAVWAPALFLVFVLMLYVIDTLGLNFSTALKNQINRMAVLAYLAYGLGFGLVYLILTAKEKRKAEQAVIIAERKAIQDELKLKTAQYDFERVSRIASTRYQQLQEASHDIRQPIGALRATMKDSRHALPENEKEQLDQIIDYLDELASSYISEDRHQSDNSSQTSLAEQSEYEQVSTRLLIDTAIRLFSKEAAQKSILLEVSDEGYELIAPPLIVVRMLSNLVANALNHSKASRICISTALNKRQMTIQVRDNGVGIAEENLSLFLTRGRKSEESPGTGLGLSSVKEHAEKFGWQFVLTSKPGEGTTASIKFSI